MTNPNTYIGLPPAEDPQIVGIRDQFQAMDNFTQVFAIRPGDRVLFLADPLLDPRVICLANQVAFVLGQGGDRQWASVDEAKASKKPDVMRLVGTDGAFGEKLGLSNDWVARIVSKVGNYAEVYDRNLGAGSQLKIERGLNRLWNKGGIQYAPPIR